MTEFGIKFLGKQTPCKLNVAAQTSPKYLLSLVHALMPQLLNQSGQAFYRLFMDEPIGALLVFYFPSSTN